MDSEGAETEALRRQTQENTAGAISLVSTESSFSSLCVVY